MMSSPLDDIGFHVLLQLMALSSIVGLIAGAALIVRPDWLVQMGKFSNRWISTRKVDRSLEQWVNLDKWFFQHHRASGSLMLAGAAWVIGFFIFSFDKQSTLAVLSRGNNVSPPLIEALIESFMLISLAGALFAVAVGLLLLLRPGLLSGLEQGTNQWLSLRKTLKPVEIPRSGVDEYVFRNGRLAGTLLLLGSIYIMAGLLLSLR
jgi:hypothetical protein